MAKKLKKTTDKRILLRWKRKKRVRKKVEGTAEKPRLSVTKTNRSLFVQIIDDVAAKTLASASTPKGKTANCESAKALGKDLAGKMTSLGINTAVFDRGGFPYHGRIKAVAEGFREAGMNI